MDIQEKLRRLPDQPGVYIFKDEEGKVLYVGKASSLRNRVRSYFRNSGNRVPRIEALIRNIRDIDTMTTSSEAEALLYESNLIKEYQPKYNVELRDSKTYPLIKITMAEDFPRVMTARGRKSDGSIYFGPYTDAALLREAVKAIRRIFLFRACGNPSRIGAPLPKKACVYHGLGLCSAPCEGRISRKEYAERIKEIVLFIEGKRASLLRHLAGKMKELSAAKKFEEAAAIRDQIEALSMSVSSRAGEAPAALGICELSKALKLKHPPRRIEAFDISNIKGEGACGSMVSFMDGRPDKANYRMFRIRGVEGQDDYAMMREIVRRRYTRLLREERALPDLILIDGGRGHLSSAAAEVKALGLARIPMIGLAKVFEHIYTLDKDLPISLPPSSRALQLVQRVRDESHRFAIRYHHILRRKALVGEESKRKKARKKKNRTV